jgi:MFS transporter, DHA2 family, multidrug resistance protein
MHGMSQRKALRDLDWTGVFLLNSGLLLVLVGISVGGAHKWTSAVVLCPFVIGVAELVVFFFWESKISANPFMARELFTEQFRRFIMFLIVDFVAGMGLYSAAAFWAQLVRGVWQGDPIEVGILSLPGGLGGARKMIARNQPL